MNLQLRFSLIILVMSCNALVAQYNNVWCFGDSILMDFNSSPPTIGTTSNSSRGTNSSICDSLGNLIFYAQTPNFVKWQQGGNYRLGVVFNKNHEIMEDGDTLRGEGWYHEMVIVNSPLNNNQYYLFHLQIGGADTGLFYSIIDMNYNNGLGKVISRDNQLSDKSFVDNVSAVKHGNGHDWWILTRMIDYQVFQENEFYVYLLTDSGVNFNGIQSIGTINQNVFDNIVFNPSGTKFTCTNLIGLVEQFDFDRCTGIISNPVTIEQPDTIYPYPFTVGCEYSPSGRYLYIAGGFDTTQLFQYDLQAANIASSKKIIFTYTDSKNAAGALKRGPDGKIYFTCAWYDGVNFNFPYSDTAFHPVNTTLSLINQPDMPDTLCDFQPFSFYLGGHRTYWGLPNNADISLGPLAGSQCAVSVSETEVLDEFEIFPNPFNESFVIRNKDFTKNTIVLIYDSKGVFIRKIEIDEYEIIDMKGCSPGIYFLDFVSADRISQKKLVKLR